MSLGPDQVREAARLGRRRANLRLLASLAPLMAAPLPEFLGARRSPALRGPHGAGPGGSRTEADRIRLDRADDKRARKAARGR